MPARRCVISGMLGSGPLGAAAHIDWFGHPALRDIVSYVGCLFHVEGIPTMNQLGLPAPIPGRDSVQVLALRVVVLLSEGSR